MSKGSEVSLDNLVNRSLHVFENACRDLVDVGTSLENVGLEYGRTIFKGCCGNLDKKEAYGGHKF